MNERFVKPVRQVLELLAVGDYTLLAELTKGVRLSSEEMAQAIKTYGGELAIPPDEAFELMDVVKVRNARPPRWSITMPLWTREEGRSDLSLDLTLVEGPNGVVIELDDLHVR